MRATNGRHSTSNGLPYTRLLAAFMLATLISTIFALPALACGAVDVVTTPQSRRVLPQRDDFVYLITVDEQHDTPARTDIVFTDTVDGRHRSPPRSFGRDGLRSPCSTTLRPAPRLVRSIDGASITVTFSVTAPAPIGTVTNTVSGVDSTRETGTSSRTSTLVATTTVDERGPADDEDARTGGRSTLVGRHIHHRGQEQRSRAPPPASPRHGTLTGVTFAFATARSCPATHAQTCPGMIATRCLFPERAIAAGTTVTFSLRRSGTSTGTVITTRRRADRRRLEARTTNNSSTRLVPLARRRLTSASASRSTRPLPHRATP